MPSNLSAIRPKRIWPIRGEVNAAAEFLVDGPVGLDDPLGDDAIARDQPGRGRGARPARGSTACGSIPRWAAGCPAPRTPSRSSGRNAAASCACSVVAPLGRVGGRLELERRLSGRSFQVARTVSRRSSKRAALAIVSRQVVEAFGQLADLAPGSLTITGGTWSAAAWRSLLVLVWLRIWNSLTLTRSSRSGRSPIRKVNGGPGAVDDRRGRHERGDDQRQQRGPRALPGAGDPA